MVAMILSLSMVFGLTLTAFADETEVAEVKAVKAAESTAASAATADGHDVTDALNRTLTEGENRIAAADATLTQLQAAAEAMNAAIAAQKEANDLVDQANTDVVAITDANTDQVELVAFNDKANKTVQDAQDAIHHATVANTVNNKQDAANAKADAMNDLASAENALADANTEVQAAEDAYQKAEENYAKALVKQQEAQARAEDARTALDNAKGNSGQAREQLEKAQEEVARLEAAAEAAALSYKNESLDRIQALYDDILDDAATDAEYQEKAARLCNWIVEYLILNTDNVTPGSIRIADTETFDLITGYEKDGEPYQKEDGLWYQKYKGTNGQVTEALRENGVKVTYTDSEGNEVVKYYNYLSKADMPADHDSVNADDPATGIYIVEVKYEVQDDGAVIVSQKDPVAAVEGLVQTSKQEVAGTNFGQGNENNPAKKAAAINRFKQFLRERNLAYAIPGNDPNGVPGFVNQVMNRLSEEDKAKYNFTVEKDKNGNWKIYSTTTTTTSGQPAVVGNAEYRAQQVHWENDTTNPYSYSDYVNDETMKAHIAAKEAAEAELAAKKAAYASAKAAVDAAEEKVAALEAEVAQLENVKIIDQKLKDLREKLDDAREKLDAAKGKQEELEVKVQEARDAVAAIDLSRFKSKPETPTPVPDW